MAPVKQPKFTPKQARFIEEYRSTLNGTEAARRAGYKGNDLTLSSVASENLRKPSIALIVSQLTNGAMESAGRKAVDVHAEFAEQLSFAKDLRRAAEQWLKASTETIDLDPRSTEVQVVYDDWLDCDQNGIPKQKKADLRELLDRIEGDKVRPDFSVVKTLDLRKFALDAISVTDACIDKFAKLGGFYQKDRTNEMDGLRACDAARWSLATLRESASIAGREYTKADWTTYVDEKIIGVVKGDVSEHRGAMVSVWDE